MKYSFKQLLDLAQAELQQLTRLENPDFRLEEAVYFRKHELWEIIVSFLVDNTNPPIEGSGTPKLSLKYLRLYKKISINNNGEMVALRFHSHKDIWTADTLLQYL